MEFVLFHIVAPVVFGCIIGYTFVSIVAFGCKIIYKIWDRLTP